MSVATVTFYLVLLQRLADNYANRIIVNYWIHHLIALIYLSNKILPANHDRGLLPRHTLVNHRLQLDVHLAHNTRYWLGGLLRLHHRWLRFYDLQADRPFELGDLVEVVSPEVILFNQVRHECVSLLTERRVDFEKDLGEHHVRVHTEEEWVGDLTPTRQQWEVILWETVHVVADKLTLIVTHLTFPGQLSDDPYHSPIITLLTPVPVIIATVFISKVLHLLILQL